MSRLYNRSSDIEASLRPRTNTLRSTSDAHTTHSPVRSQRKLSQVPLCHVSPTPSSQTLIPMFPSTCEKPRSTQIAHRNSVQRSSHDETMKPEKPPTYSAVCLHQRASVARCSPVPNRKSGDGVYSSAELHSPTFSHVLGL